MEICICASTVLYGIFVLFVIILTMCVLKIVHTDKKTNSYNIQNALFSAIAVSSTRENDVIKCVELVKSKPQIINEKYPLDGYTPFMRACLMGRTQIVFFMLNNGADISITSSKSETPFYLAVYNLIQNRHKRDASCIRVLYYAGCNINAPNYKGYSPLHLAAMFGHNGLVRWLLSKGASVTGYPNPYILARFQGHYDTAMLLKNTSIPAIEG